MWATRACALGQYATAFVRETSLTGVELISSVPKGLCLAALIVAETEVRGLPQGGMI